MKFLNEINKKFGRWTVLKQGTTKRKLIHWVCQCDCGIHREVSGVSLRSGKSKSCGCDPGKRAKPKGEAAFKFCFWNYKYWAKKRGLSWKLSKEQFRNLTTSNCFYCGKVPSQKKKQRNFNGEYVYNGIDRVDNTKGYIVENCVSCCKICNYMKRALTQQEFFNHINQIAKYLKEIK